MIHELKIIYCKIIEAKKTGFDIPKDAKGVTIILNEYTNEYEIRYLVPVEDGIEIEGEIKHG